MKKALVCGAGGFIGSHLVKRLKNEGYWVRGIDLKYPEFNKTEANEFILADLREAKVWQQLTDQEFDEVYQLAADMGGAGYVFVGEHDANIMHNSATINLNCLATARQHCFKKIFYSSSACIYPKRNQEDADRPQCSEASAYPAQPDSEYGWEKLFSERLYLSFARNYGLNVRIARFHNIFGPEGTWQGGKEKAPAALCRKVAQAHVDGEIEIWGDGQQTRSFLFIDECLTAVRLLMDSNFSQPINIGSEEMVSIDQLATKVMEIAGKQLRLKHIPGPVGVRGRNSDNSLWRQHLGWQPSHSLNQGLTITYQWIKSQIENNINN